MKNLKIGRKDEKRKNYIKMVYFVTKNILI